ncbi:MAG: translocation/assembly module TamB domain-containing protein, partial [Bacteroidales bacterium]|nr:translocation/assembly module TamB domain-containing protein [Candidatus Physcousia equi]
LWQPTHPDRFDPAHITVNDLSVKAELPLLTSDSLSVVLKHLSCKAEPGINILQGEARLTQSQASGWRLTHLALNLPASSIETDELTLRNSQLAGAFALNISPSDLTFIHPSLKRVQSGFSMQFQLDANPSEARISHLSLKDTGGGLALLGEIEASQLDDSVPSLHFLLHDLALKEDFAHAIAPLVQHDEQAPQSEWLDRLRPILSALGASHIKGEGSWSGGAVQGEMSITGQVGEAHLRGHYSQGKLAAKAELSHFRAGLIMQSVGDSTAMLGNVTSVVDAELLLRGAGGMPEGKVSARVSEATVRDYTFQDITVDATRHGSHLDVSLHSHDKHAALDAEFEVNTSDQQPCLRGYADIHNLDLHATHLAPHARFSRINAKMGVDFAGNTFNNMEGTLSIPHILLHEEEGNITFDRIQLSSTPEGDRRHITFRSPFLTAQADGDFMPHKLGHYFQQLLHERMPSIVSAPAPSALSAEADIELQLIDAEPLSRLARTELVLDKGPLTLKAHLSRDAKAQVAQLHANSLRYGNEELLDLDFLFSASSDSLQSALQFKRMMKSNPVSVQLDLSSKNDFISARLAWNDHLSVRNRGELALRGEIEHPKDGGLAFAADIFPSEIYISDTLWHIKPAQFFFHNQRLQVYNFQLAMEGDDRSLSIHGAASGDGEDLLYLDLRQMDLTYIFDLARIKPLTLGGLATGSFVARHTFRQPEVTGRVHVPYFTFNKAHLGDCNCALKWGVTPGNLDIDAVITDTAASSRVDVAGSLHLLKDPVQSLDLNIAFERVNAAFLQRYVAHMMDDFQGRASGGLRVFGEFKNVDLYGNVLAHEAALTIPSLNVRYHAVNDSIFLRPGYVELRNVTAYDSEGGPGKPGHKATVNGRITYEHFRNTHFNFELQGEDILAYDQKEFGDQTFYATVWGSGKVKLDGGPGYTNIDISATPTLATTLTYNTAGPRTLTQTGFVTFVDRSAPKEEQMSDSTDTEKPANDMRINFDLDLKPNTTLRLLMDPRTDDHITLHGIGRLRASYYNKAGFQMYGTYTVDRGNYRMTMQDVIRKDFQFRQGGTIVFGGAPFDADLNLQAVYTVPSVSLNDLSARSTFSNSNVRVNCLMNLGGKAGTPHVTFDFDIPNVNEDEARMVRSLISTEEERNMQVIYLLGIGRFYTYDNNSTEQTQSSAAVNSLLSTTLSGQINQMMSNILGNSSNWSFGANLSTGNTGWRDMDIEGMLSGRLLNNRLLINGNFGYRDNPVAASNFIGDFDLQWLLNKNGNIILKAYSETNDRYFTKSALTTQGLGIMLKRDFYGWRDLFGIKNKRNKTEENKKTEAKEDK